MAIAKKMEIAPLMEAYGAAVFEGQNLEHGLGLLLRVVDDERKKSGLAPLNADIDDPQSYKTIGQLFAKAKTVEFFTKDELKIIQRGIRDRNYLVHSYWLEDRVAATLTPDGRNWLLKDLNHRRESCRAADRLVSKFIDAYLEKCGSSIDALSTTLWEQWVNDEESSEDELH